MPGDSTVKHNAKFSRSILDEIQEVVNTELKDADWDVWMLDPFGGVGGIFDIKHPAIVRTDMVELQPLWAKQAVLQWVTSGDPSRFVFCEDFFAWADRMNRWGQYNIGCTSTTYGNRMADKHHAREDSHRNTYAHTLRRQGEDLYEGNSGGLQWGEEYRFFHIKAWKYMWRLLEPGGLFILNIKDHIRKGELQGVPAWHRTTIERIGFYHCRTIQVPVRGNRQGENGELRVDHEEVQVYRKPYLVARPKKGKPGRVHNFTQPALREKA